LLDQDVLLWVEELAPGLSHFVGDWPACLSGRGRAPLEPAPRPRSGKRRRMHRVVVEAGYKAFGGARRH
jgi:hypothetical protein